MPSASVNRVSGTALRFSPRWRARATSCGSTGRSRKRRKTPPEPCSRRRLWRWLRFAPGGDALQTVAPANLPFAPAQLRSEDAEEIEPRIANQQQSGLCRFHQHSVSRDEGGGGVSVERQ